ncbi:signal peptide-containing protein [Cryptosporidium parvum]
MRVGKIGKSLLILVLSLYFLILSLDLSFINGDNFGIGIKLVKCDSEFEKNKSEGSESLELGLELLKNTIGKAKVESGNGFGDKNKELSTMDGSIKSTLTESENFDDSEKSTSGSFGGENFEKDDSSVSEDSANKLGFLSQSLGPTFGRDENSNDSEVDSATADKVIKDKMKKIKEFDYSSRESEEEEDDDDDDDFDIKKNNNLNQEKKNMPINNSNQKMVNNGPKLIFNNLNEPKTGLNNYSNTKTNVNNKDNLPTFYYPGGTGISQPDIYNLPFGTNSAFSANQNVIHPKPTMKMNNIQQSGGIAINNVGFVNQRSLSTNQIQNQNVIKSMPKSQPKTVILQTVPITQPKPKLKPKQIVTQTAPKQQPKTILIQTVPITKPKPKPKPKQTVTQTAPKQQPKTILIQTVPITQPKPKPKLKPKQNVIKSVPKSQPKTVILQTVPITQPKPKPKPKQIVTQTAPKQQPKTILIQTVPITQPKPKPKPVMTQAVPVPQPKPAMVQPVPVPMPMPMPMPIPQQRQIMAQPVPVPVPVPQPRQTMVQPITVPVPQPRQTMVQPVTQPNTLMLYTVPVRKTRPIKAQTVPKPQPKTIILQALTKAKPKRTSSHQTNAANIISNNTKLRRNEPFLLIKDPSLRYGPNVKRKTPRKRIIPIFIKNRTPRKASNNILESDIITKKKSKVSNPKGEESEIEESDNDDNNDDSDDSSDDDDNDDYIKLIHVHKKSKQNNNKRNVKYIYKDIIHKPKYINANQLQNGRVNSHMQGQYLSHANNNMSGQKPQYGIPMFPMAPNPGQLQNGQRMINQGMRESDDDMGSFQSNSINAYKDTQPWYLQSTFIFSFVGIIFLLIAGAIAIFYIAA